MSKLKSSNGRRDFVKKAAYVAPVVMTMNAAPSLAGSGSARGPVSKKKAVSKKRVSAT